MQKPRFVFRFFTVVVCMLCLGSYSTCKDPGNDTTQPDTETQLEINNLEQFRVILYNDSSRHNIFAEIAANGKTTVSATPNNSGVTYYPTYYIDVPEIPDTNIPYNGQAIVTVIEANKVNKVFIPKLENIVINTAYLKIINDSIYSLSLQQGGNEKVPLGGRPSIIASGQNAAYEINPGTSSGYAVMRNTTTPVDFPASFTEFEKGKVYVFTYSGTGLVRTATWPIPSPGWPTAPGNLKVELMSTSSARLTWDAIYDAASYRIYRAAGSTATSYTQIAVTNTPFYTDSGLTSDQLYYYKISAIKGSEEGEQSNVVFVITINWGNEAHGTLTVVNNTSKGMILFNGQQIPTVNNIIGGVRALSSKTVDISDDVNNFQLGGYMMLRGFTDDEYEANKDDLSKAKTVSLGMATYGQGKKFKVEINSYYIGEYAYRVTNLGRIGMELRRNGPTGEKIGYIPALAHSMIVYANSQEIFAIYPVYIVYSKSTAQTTILNIGEFASPVAVSPKPITSNEIPEYNFNSSLNMSAINSPVAYVTVTNNVNQSGLVRIPGAVLKSQNGYDTIDYGETLTYEIPSTDYGSAFNVYLTYYNQTLQIPVNMNGSIPVLRNGYDYRISVSGSGTTADGYIVVFTEDGQRDLNNLVNF